jgi:short-subunit dehydrogenase
MKSATSSTNISVSYDFAGKTVLVTGASGGIGEAFARELSRRRARLVLVARSASKLRALSVELGNAHVIAQDLGSPGAARRVFDEATRLGAAVDVLINNAGFGRYGRFGELPLSEQRAEIDLNVIALVELTHLFMPTIETRRGGVIFVASIAGYFPTPYLSVYGATKAFVLSFGEALWAEYRDRGVRVLTLSPGQTATGFFVRAGEGLRQQTQATPEDVVRFGLASFQRRMPSVIHGTRNAFLQFLTRFFPRETLARMSARLPRQTRSQGALPSGG